MSTQSPHTGHDRSVPRVGSAHGGHGAHRWMMIASCIPMLLVLGALVVSGAAGAGIIMVAVVCLAMMALMMFATPGDKH